MHARCWRIERVRFSNPAKENFLLSIHCGFRIDYVVMGDGAGNWCLIESDPGVFTELIQKFGTIHHTWEVRYIFLLSFLVFDLFVGVSGVQVEELWSLDKDHFEKLKPVHGLIFLFKWVPDENPQGTVVRDSRADDMFFAKQVSSGPPYSTRVTSWSVGLSV